MNEEGIKVSARPILVLSCFKYQMFITKISQYQYINTFNKDIFIKFRKRFQSPTRNVLDAKVEFVCWCPYFELKTLKYLHKEM